MPWPSGPVVVSMPSAMPVFGMAGGLAVDLAKALQLIQRHVLDAGQVQQAVEQHRAVAVRQHEAVAIEPMRIGRVELHEILVENGRDVGHAHRRAGMAAVGVLHGVHGQRPDAVGQIPQMLVAGLGDRLDGRSGRDVSHDWRLLLREIGWGGRLRHGFANSGAASKSSHLLGPIGARRPGFKRVTEILGLAGHLAIPEFHDADRVGRLTVVRQDEFGDPKIAAANDTADFEAL